jgi:chromosome segregation ATPase
MKENLAYCRRRIEELETQQSSLKIPDSQQTEQLMRPTLEALSRLSAQEENFKKLILDIEEKNSLFKKALQENAVRQKQMEEEFKGLLRNLTERIEFQIAPISKSLIAMREELDKITSSLGHLNNQEKMIEDWLGASPLPQKPSKPQEKPGTNEKLDDLEQDFQKILSILDSGFPAPHNSGK